jgi:hypothetical protein
MRKITRERRTYERYLYTQTKIRYHLQHGNTGTINKASFNKMRE